AEDGIRDKLVTGVQTCALPISVSQFSSDRVTYALRTAGDPLSYVRSVQEIVRQADSRIPVTSVVTQAAEIDRTISRELTFAKLRSEERRVGKECRSRWVLAGVM